MAYGAKQYIVFQDRGPQVLLKRNGFLLVSEHLIIPTEDFEFFNLSCNTTMIPPFRTVCYAVFVELRGPLWSENIRFSFSTEGLLTAFRFKEVRAWSDLWPWCITTPSRKTQGRYLCSVCSGSITNSISRSKGRWSAVLQGSLWWFTSQGAAVTITSAPCTVGNKNGNWNFGMIMKTAFTEFEELEKLCIEFYWLRWEPVSVKRDKGNEFLKLAGRRLHSPVSSYRNGVITIVSTCSCGITICQAVRKASLLIWDGRTDFWDKKWCWGRLRVTTHGQQGKRLFTNQSAFEQRLQLLESGMDMCEQDVQFSYKICVTV